MIFARVVQYVLKAALRDRLFITLLLVVASGASLAIFLASGALIETDRFSLVFTAGGLRLACVMGLVLFTVFYIRRSFDARDVDFLLSRPVARPVYLLAHTAAFFILSLIVTALVAVVIWIVAPHRFGEGTILWCFGLFMELLIVMNAALFFAMFLSSAAGAAMSVLGLYILSRLIGELMGVSSSRLYIGDHDVLQILMHTIALVVPRLDLIGQTSWLVYGPDPAIGFVFILAQGMIFTGLLTAAAMVDLSRRQF